LAIAKRLILFFDLKSSSPKFTDLSPPADVELAWLSLLIRPAFYLNFCLTNYNKKKIFHKFEYLKEGEKTWSKDIWDNKYPKIKYALDENDFDWLELKEDKNQDIHKIAIWLLRDQKWLEDLENEIGYFGTELNKPFYTSNFRDYNFFLTLALDQRKKKFTTISSPIHFR